MTHKEKQVLIIDCAVHTGLGDLKETWQGLTRGHSGLSRIKLPGLAGEYPVGRAVAANVPYGSTGRLDTLMTRGIDTLASLPLIRGRCGVIVATTKGAVDELLCDPDPRAGQPWHLGRTLADLFDSRWHQTVSAACASGTIALIQAARQIRSGRASCMVVVGIDLLSRFVMSGFDALKALSEIPCRPFDRNRDGLNLGEGVGIMVLCSPEFAEDQGIAARAEVRSWGVSCDATHITAPSRTGTGLRRVLKQVSAGRNRIGAVNAHGTGTVYNDAMELTAFRAHFDRIPPVHSVKGAIGHTLGAAGVIEGAIALRSLEKGHIPPTTGFSENDDAGGCLSGSRIQEIIGDTILSCNSGFGGINAGILLGRVRREEP